MRASSCKTEAQQCKWLPKESLVDSTSHRSERKETRMSWASPGWLRSWGSWLRHSAQSYWHCAVPTQEQLRPTAPGFGYIAPPALSKAAVTILILNVTSSCNEKARLLRKRTTKHCKNPSLFDKDVHFQFKEQNTVVWIAHYTFL